MSNLISFILFLSLSFLAHQGLGQTQSRVCTGLEFSCALSTTGHVRCWGENDYGQLGYGDTTYRGDQGGEMGLDLPIVNIGAGETATALTCGIEHVCVRLASDDKIKCWGRNNHGQLGLGDTENRGDEPGEMGDNLPRVNIGTVRTALRVDAGHHFTCVNLDSRNVKCWGLNDVGQLGQGNTNNLLSPPSGSIDIDAPGGVQQLSVGFDHVCVRLDTARGKCWGGASTGQIGSGATDNLGDDAGEMGANLPLLSLGANHQIRSILAGYFTSCAILQDDTLKCWGWNSQGQLGYATVVGNENVGDDAGEMGANLAAVDFGSGSPVPEKVALGDEESCTFFVDGTIKCYGLHSSLSSPPNSNAFLVDMGTNIFVENIDQIHYHGCVVLRQGTTSGAGIKCFGVGNGGRLGYGSGANRLVRNDVLGDTLPFVDLALPPPTPSPTGAPTPEPTANPSTSPTSQPTFPPTLPPATVPLPNANQAYTCAGRDHSCALSAAGQVKCWGSNQYGQLGLGDTLDRGDSASEMGQNLPVVDLGVEEAVDQLSCGFEHTCVRLQSTRQIKCWGRNNDGQLGLGDNDNRGDNPGEMGTSLPSPNIGTGRNVLQVSTRGSFTCVLLDSGNVKCWGSNSGGQLGIGTTTSLLSPSSNSIDLGADNNVVQISTGTLHVCAVVSNGGSARSLKCWGSAIGGRLGYGDQNGRGNEAGEMGTALPAVDVGTNRQVQTVYTGDSNTCVLLVDGGVKCWGSNVEGEACVDSTTTPIIGDEPGEMGDNLPTINYGTALGSATVESVSILDESICTLFSDGRAKCCGLSGTTSPPDDRSPFLNIGQGYELKQLSGYFFHNCFLLQPPGATTLGVKCTGTGTNGRLGQGDTNAIGIETLPQVPFVDLRLPPTTAPTGAPTTVAQGQAASESASDQTVLIIGIIALVLALICILVYCLCGRDDDERRVESSEV